jgi:ubiquinone/menaquinone biosynthesis C-methylase UbiE
MTTNPEQGASSSAYFIHDSSTELARLVKQERALAKALGGLLPEQEDQEAFVAPLQRVLDAACGSGGWVLEMARTYPHLEVLGFDIDARMIEYATTQAPASGFANAGFRVLDARQPLDYPDDFFDLVSARWLGGVGPQKWVSTLQEFKRVICPGGYVRLTETETFSLSNSAALEQLSSMFTQALKRVGLSLSPDGRHYGITPMLASFVREAGYENIRRRPLVIDWSSGMPDHDAISDNIKVLVRLLQPFLVNVGMIGNEEFERLYHEAEMDMLSDTFCALWNFYTIWARKPE